MDKDRQYIKEMLHFLKMGIENRNNKISILSSEIDVLRELVDNIENHINKVPEKELD